MPFIIQQSYLRSRFVPFVAGDVNLLELLTSYVERIARDRAGNETSRLVRWIRPSMICATLDNVVAENVNITQVAGRSIESLTQDTIAPFRLHQAHGQSRLSHKSKNQWRQFDA